MFEYLDKNTLGALSVLLTLFCYLPYFWLMVTGAIKPHLLSWIVWGMANGVVFFAQYTEQGGPGSWVAGITAVFCFIIAAFSAFRGEKNITRGDWISFTAAMMTIPLWIATNDPLGAVILATMIDGLGFYPTLRKSFRRPYDESVFTWGIAGLRSFISLLALEHYNAATMIFPIVMSILNSGMALFLVWRRSCAGIARTGA